MAPSGELRGKGRCGVLVCLQVKLCDPHLSALEVRFSWRGAIQIYVYLYLQLRNIWLVFGTDLIRIWIQDQFFHFCILRARAFSTLNANWKSCRWMSIDVFYKGRPLDRKQCWWRFELWVLSSSELFSWQFLSLLTWCIVVSNNLSQNQVFQFNFVFAAENNDGYCTELSRRLQIPVVSIK